MYPLKFTEGDLEANRRGSLTDAQRKRLDADVETIQRYTKYMTWFFIGCVVVVFTLTLIGEFSSAQGDMSRLFTPSNITGFAIMIGVFLTLFVMIVGWTWWTMRRLSRAEVRAVEGNAQIISTYTTVRGMRVPMHRLYLHRGWLRRFTLYFPTAESLRYFKNGQRYRVYYVPYSMPYPLSVEEIDEKDKRR